MKRKLPLLLFFLSILNGCGDFKSSSQTPSGKFDLGNFEEAKELWASSKTSIPNHDVAITNSSLFSRYATTVEVRDGIPVACKRVAIEFGSETETDCSSEPNLATVDHIFDSVQKMASEGYDALSVQYDETYGFPVSVSADWKLGYIDDESSSYVELTIR